MGLAAAGIATTGAVVAVVTIKSDVESEPALAVIVAEPAEDGAEYRPVGLRVPTPDKVHVKLGWLGIGVPNWSFSTAENCRDPLTRIAKMSSGVMRMLAVGWTVTFTWLVAVAAPLVLVTVKVYSPTAVNVAVIFLPAFVPFPVL